MTVGEEAQWIAEEAVVRGMAPQNVVHFKNWEGAVQKLLGILEGGDRVLLKASRGIGLERVAAALKESAGTP
jgi:UDP-N-acetylmuramoyl-tripeptide--D-alanyl-D-alanine ligase